jgi:hypothetical protein
VGSYEKTIVESLPMWQVQHLLEQDVRYVAGYLCCLFDRGVIGRKQRAVNMEKLLHYYQERYKV